MRELVYSEVIKFTNSIDRVLAPKITEMFIDFNVFENSKII